MSISPFDLKDRKALVTGGGQGIGLAFARGLAEAGADVMLVARQSVHLEAAREALSDTGAGVDIFSADVTRESDCEALANYCREQFGELDILVNNAGTNWRGMPQDYTLEQWKALIDVNLTSVFLVSRCMFPMLSIKGGKIINVGSMTSIFGTTHTAPYGAAKGGVVQLTRALASARYDIQVNAILPGWIDTDLTARGREASPELHDKVLARTPAGRWGQPQDLVGAGVFLASAASNFVTGIAMPVDGGYSAEG
ncbi:SDR family oxidoreductase [Salinicola corii]|uniref:SDR family oxidoreductase n=1 Tax=Salinicola corii TaxID=2606937 RepID=A0A640WH14_9GAMM|nr:SDR family oxidoreductase [Salinicola corii]KAA0019642.1 SDR family oxidoreductase [Salinicola corii]